MATETISVLIIEDEALWQKHLELCLDDYGYVVAGMAGNAADALSLIGSAQYDIALVDIDLQGSSTGIQLGMMISGQYKKPFIFITANSSPDIVNKAVGARPAAYLLKPYTAPALFATLQLALQNFEKEQTPVSVKPDKGQDDIFFVKTGSGYRKINWNDVVYLATDKNYTRLVTENGHEHIIRSSLQKTLKIIVPEFLQEQFIQLNRAEAVQRSFITEVRADEVITKLRSFAVKDSFEKELRLKLNMIS